MSIQSVMQRLSSSWASSGSLLCVGLDPFPERLPKRFDRGPNGVLSFNKMVIDATADVVCAYKPQIAHYSAHAMEEVLAETIAYVRSASPTAFVILDAKRGDIGSTAEQYAREAFDRYDADAVTVNPYLGTDGVHPFITRPDRAAIVLCRTSNPSAFELQDLQCLGEPLYCHVAKIASEQWNSLQNLMLVVGATYTDEMRAIRSMVGDIPFLVPGIGAQGGDIHAVIQAGLDSRGLGLIISSSRAILYAGDGSARAIRNSAVALRDEINEARA